MCIRDRKKAAGSKTYIVPKTNKHKERKLKTHLSFLKDASSGIYAGKTGYWEDDNCSVAVGYREDGLSLFIGGHVHEQQRADFVRDFAHAFVVPFARIGINAVTKALFEVSKSPAVYFTPLNSKSFLARP